MLFETNSTEWKYLGYSRVEQANFTGGRYPPLMMRCGENPNLKRLQGEERCTLYLEIHVKAP